MNPTLKEEILAENKLVKPSDKLWDWDMTRTIAALYNSGGGILRAGVDDNGKAVGFNNLSDYEPDKSPLAATLARYLIPIPPFFEPTLRNESARDYVEIRVREGVTFPVILKKELAKPDDKDPKTYAVGTVFIRTMDNQQVCSRPLRTPNDWQTSLHLWETNRGATVQGPLMAQFCLVINKWNPFDPDDTEVKKWEAKCVADTAKTLGREKLWTGLVSIWTQMQLSTKTPSSNQAIKDQEGSDYKQPLLQKVGRLCEELGLAVKI